VGDVVEEIVEEVENVVENVGNAEEMVDNEGNEAAEVEEWIVMVENEVDGGANGVGIGGNA
jgi:hypothetical protein